MKRTGRTPRLPVAARRVIIRGCIALQIAELAIQAVLVRTIHHSAAVTFAGVIIPVVGVLSGMFYLYSTRGKS